MADAAIIAAADAIVETINAASLSQAFTATRQNRPRFDLPGLADLTVTVAPRRVTKQWRGRNDQTDDLVVDVAVVQRFDDTGEAPGNDETDPLIYLAEEIAATLWGQRLGDDLGVIVATDTGDDLFDLDDLDQQHLFFCLIACTIRRLG